MLSLFPRGTQASVYGGQVTKIHRQEEHSTDVLILKGEGVKVFWKTAEDQGTGQEKVNQSCLKGGAVFSQVEKSPVGRQSPVI